MLDFILGAIITFMCLSALLAKNNRKVTRIQDLWKMGDEDE